MTDLQLLPGRWSRPNAPFVTHALFAAEDGDNEKNRVDSNGKHEARAHSTVPCPPANKRPRNVKTDSSSGASERFHIVRLLSRRRLWGVAKPHLTLNSEGRHCLISSRLTFLWLDAEGPTPAASPVYAHSRAGPVATVRRGVRTKVAELHLYSHHWEVLARISYKYAFCLYQAAAG